jgi:hypothetical protein
MRDFNRIAVYSPAGPAPIISTRFNRTMKDPVPRFCVARQLNSKEKFLANTHFQPGNST